MANDSDYCKECKENQINIVCNSPLKDTFQNRKYKNAHIDLDYYRINSENCQITTYTLYTPFFFLTMINYIHDCYNKYKCKFIGIYIKSLSSEGKYLIGSTLEHPALSHSGGLSLRVRHLEVYWVNVEACAVRWRGKLLIIGASNFIGKLMRSLSLPVQIDLELLLIDVALVQSC